MTRWSRLWQPRRGVFWLMLLFNALSSGLAWAVRTLPLNNAGLVLFAVLALMNIAMGLWAMRMLLQLPRGTPSDPA